MTPSQILLVAVAVVALLGAVAAFVIAYRREGGTAPWRSRLDRDALGADRSAPREPVATATVVTDTGEEVPEIAEAPEAPRPEVASVPGATAVAVREVERYVEVSPEELGVTRRQFFNRALLATFAAYAGGLGIAMLAFMWPRIRGGFGSDIDAGDIQDLRDQIFQADGTILPLFIPEARAYIVPFPVTDLPDSQFDPTKLGGAVVVSNGLTALFQRCVHLGCRVPWCHTSQGFECPCHGSRYNFIGEYEGGPAPRNLDRFEVVVTESNRFIIKTGSLILTSRAPAKTVLYPQGPSCLGVQTVPEE
jgi:cytochrome b6-f complex iron-sulfur subunit